MISSVLIFDSPNTSQEQYKALDFVKTALAKNINSINSVFFYMDAVYMANNNISLANDEINLARQWFALQEQSNSNLQLNLCVGASIRRGILDEQQAKILGDKHISNIAKGFKLRGLASFYKSLTADELAVFTKNQSTKFPLLNKQNKKRRWLFEPIISPYDGFYFREIYELALFLASFDEQVYFVLSNQVEKTLAMNKQPQYFGHTKNLTKMLQAARDFNLLVFNKADWITFKKQHNINRYIHLK